MWQIFKLASCKCNKKYIHCNKRSLSVIKFWTCKCKMIYTCTGFTRRIYGYGYWHLHTQHSSIPNLHAFNHTNNMHHALWLNFLLPSPPTCGLLLVIGAFWISLGIQGVHGVKLQQWEHGFRVLTMVKIPKVFWAISKHYLYTLILGLSPCATTLEAMALKIREGPQDLALPYIKYDFSYYKRPWLCMTPPCERQTKVVSSSQHKPAPTSNHG
jgi:hypothetical protein